MENLLHLTLVLVAVGSGSVRGCGQRCYLSSQEVPEPIWSEEEAIASARCFAGCLEKVRIYIQSAIQPVCLYVWTTVIFTCWWYRHGTRPLLWYGVSKCTYMYTYIKWCTTICFSFACFVDCVIPSTHQYASSAVSVVSLFSIREQRMLHTILLARLLICTAMYVYMKSLSSVRRVQGYLLNVWVMLSDKRVWKRSVFSCLHWLHSHKCKGIHTCVSINAKPR